MSQTAMDGRLECLTWMDHFQNQIDQPSRIRATKKVSQKTLKHRKIDEPKPQQKNPTELLPISRTANDLFAGNNRVLIVSDQQAIREH